MCTQDACEEAAPLFGRGDHTAREQALTVRDRCDLLVRASFLVTVFLPFLLLGPLLLLLAAQFAPSVPAQRQAAILGAGPQDAGPSEQQVLLCCAVMCCFVLCRAALCCAAPMLVCCCAVLCCFVLCRAVLHLCCGAVLCRAVLCCAAPVLLWCAVLCCVVLCCALLLHCSMLPWLLDFIMHADQASRCCQQCCIYTRAVAVLCY